MSSLTTAKYLDISEAAGSRKENENCQIAESKTEFYNLTKKIDLTKFVIDWYLGQAMFWTLVIGTCLG